MSTLDTATVAVDADNAIEVFQTATEENQLSSLRQDQVVALPDAGEVWMTGDLHDHRGNFAKLLAAADLANNPQRHLILHELIHGDRLDDNHADSSWETLFQAAELKCDYPEQIHFLLANHDLAQIHGEGIMKAGMSVCEAFTAGVHRDFGSGWHGVNVAISEFLLSLPLAVRGPNGLFFCHSLPADEEVEEFDYSIFRRALSGPDYRRRTGPVYQLIWGRNIAPTTAAAFADKVEAKIVITGHQPQENGFLVNGERHLILASDHGQGVFLPIDLARTYTMDELVADIRKFVAVDVEADSD
jgi:hypothetical protein